MKTGVILMAHGTPDHVDEMEEYLSHVMKHRPPTPEFVEQIRERYKQIGGKSPLTEITRRQAAALSKQIEMPVFVGMRHWKPLIGEAVWEAEIEGVDRLVALAMAPHFSPVSVGGYFEDLKKALPSKISLVPVEQWHLEPEFIAAWAERMPQSGNVLFTAHSVPVETAGVYPAQVKETIEAIRVMCPDLRWDFGWQSKSPSPIPWLEPDVTEVIETLADAGVTELSFAPIGFVTDNVELLYDLDILHAGTAAALGLKASRIPSLNDSPRFIGALASVVKKALA